MNDPPQRRRVVAAPARRPPAELRATRVVFEPDPNPDPSYLNENGRAAYERDEFDYMCVCAEAEVVIDGVAQTLKSSGAYNIESDAEDEYLDELIAQEWSVLRGVLKSVGVSTEQLPLAVEREWIKWRT
jgi:hypothetical protein